MPYEIRHVGSEYCVFKQGTERRFGCHPSQAEAKRQLRALYASELNAQKAVLTSRTRENLPDSAFACPEKRLYPHHRADGSVDRAHLANAMARVGDASNDQCGKAHLMAHAREMGMGQ